MKSLLLLSLTTMFTFQAHADICGKTDDRALSFDPKIGRLAKEGQHIGCAVTMISNSCAITVGACAEDRDYAEFNVPVSIAGIPQASAPEDVYYVTKGASVFQQGGVGQQWAVIKFEPNRLTNKFPGEVQGFYNVAMKKSHDNDAVRVVGYGYALNDAYYVQSGEVLPNSNGDVMHYAQQVSYGKLVKAGVFLSPNILEHDGDTSYGSWGAPIISEKTNEVVGVNTHGGCKASYVVTAGARLTNTGTSVVGSRKFKQAIAACLAK